MKTNTIQIRILWTNIETGIIGNGGTVSRVYPQSEGALKFFKTVRE